MANTSLRREVSVTGNRKIFTLSAWVKKTKLADNQNIFSQYVGSGSATIATHFRIRFGTTDNLQVAAGGTNLLITNRLFRDTSAWYHIVCAVDTTQGTADDRIKLYVNGVQETSFSARSNPTQNVDTVVNLAGSSHYPRIGADDADGAGPYNYFDGLMSHVHFVDGTAYAASTFGSTDSTTGEWQINTSPSITMGTNGFTILKDGNTITDQSSNSNNFTLVAGTLTKTEDCPSNVFAAFNPLDNYFPAGTYKNGNTTVNTGNNYAYPQATIYVNKGKWYWEVKAISKVSGGDEYMIGIQGRSATAVNQPAQANHGITVYGTDGDTYGFGGGATTYAAAYTAGDIVGVALDCDNNKLYFSKNGAWSTGSGAWGSTTFNSSTGALTITDPNDVPQGGYSPVAGAYTSVSHEMSYNFGNGYFGTTAVSSAGTNASGIGIFEYNVPTGYTALSTKGLNL
jgi:hypothetical protein